MWPCQSKMNSAELRQSVDNVNPSFQSNPGLDCCIGDIHLSSGQEGAKELGVSIFPIYSLFNGEPFGAT